MTKQTYTTTILLIALTLSFIRGADHQRAVLRYERKTEKLERTIKAQKLKASRFQILSRELEWEVKGLKAAAKVTDRALLNRMNRILKRDLERLEGEAE